MSNQKPQVLAPVRIGQSTEFLPLDYSAAATYCVEFNTQINTDHPLGDRINIQAVSLQEAIGSALMKNPTLSYASVVKHIPAQGDPVSTGDEDVMVPVRVGDITEFRALSQRDTPTFQIFFGCPIETSDPNGDRLAIGAVTIEEAVGCILMQHPVLSYDDIEDHMEV